jgi:hypothetical protein
VTASGSGDRERTIIDRFHRIREGLRLAHLAGVRTLPFATGVVGMVKEPQALIVACRRSQETAIPSTISAADRWRAAASRFPEWTKIFSA